MIKFLNTAITRGPDSLRRLIPTWAWRKAFRVSFYPNFVTSR